MKGSVTIICCFIAGCFLGRVIETGIDLHTVSLALLYVLMVQVGIGIGLQPETMNMLKKIGLKDVLLPIATVTGALAISAIAGLALSRISVPEALAINYGCGYYSLSSILINQIMIPKAGELVAAELATIALLSNVFRELMALVFAPLISRKLGGDAMIAAAGVTSTDVCLPAIRRWSGVSFTGTAILHGVLIDITTPLFVTLFCEMSF